jgi:hypothetical protein
VIYSHNSSLLKSSIIDIFSSSTILGWYKIHQNTLFLSKTSKHIPDSVANWQSSNVFTGMEPYFKDIKTYFGQSTYDNIVEKYLAYSKAYLDSFNLDEWHIYGSTRIGIYQNKINLAYVKFYSDNSKFDSITITSTTVVASSYNFYTLVRGNKRYELTNHLGNVLTVITDKKIPVCENDSVDNYYAEIISATDYSPFGAPLPGRTWQSTMYRFGFNGQEKDNDVSGVGNTMTAEFWEYDARLGRRWNIDPVVYAWQSGYVCLNNSPIFFYDYYGLEGEPGDRTTGPSKGNKDGNSALSYLDNQNNSNKKDNPSWLKKLVDFITSKHNGPPGKWVKDSPRNWTQLQGTFNSNNNTFSYSPSSMNSFRLISYKIEIDYPDPNTNWSAFSLIGLVPGSLQKTSTLYTGLHIPLNPFESNPTKTYSSGIGGKVTDIGGTLLLLSTSNYISLNPAISATIMMTGQILGNRINPLYRDYTNFYISINSNQNMVQGDIRMYVRYKRYIPYGNLTNQQKGIIKRWYYGF